MNHIDLRTEVQDAARTAHASGKPISKADIWHLFKDRPGAGRGSVHRWVDAVIEEMAVKEVLKRRGVRVGVKPGVAPKAGVRRRAGAEDPVRVLLEAAGPDVVIASDPNAAAIAFETLLATCIRECEGLLTLAKGDDGKIRNARLAGSAVDQLRRTLATAAGIYTSLQNQEKANRQDFYSKFMDELLAIVMQEMPATRDKVLARFESLRQQYARYDKARR
jgi:hypothetical protein